MPCIVSALIFLFLFYTDAYAQLSYQISNYEMSSYGAGNQNWAITSDEHKHIYVANNNGLLLLKNSDIQLFDFGDATTFRSVKVIDNRVYTGSFEEFGYWEYDENDQLAYTSLAKDISDLPLSNDEIWSIAEQNGIIYFHSFGDIYAYDGTTTQRLNKNGSFMFLHKIEDRIFTQAISGSLYELRNNALQEIPNSNFLNDEEVKSIIKLDSTHILIGTTKGLYTFDGENFENWEIENAAEVIENEINTIVRTSDKVVIGTILNGIYVYDLNYSLLKVINTNNQLPNNTVLSLYADPYNNVWAGLDKGLSYIAFDTPIHSYLDEFTDVGSVYAGSIFGNELYIGTNQGLFWYKKDKKGNFYDRQLIPGTQGQVWFVKEIDGELYAGLNEGTFLIKNKRLVSVSPVSGGYTLKSYNGNSKNRLLQSTYSVLVSYSKKDGVYQQDQILEGFSAPAHHLEFDHMGNIWLGHTVKGVFQLQPNMAFNEIESMRRITEEQGLPESTNRVFKLDNRIMSSSKGALYEWDAINQTFVPYTNLDPFLPKKALSPMYNP